MNLMKNFSAVNAATTAAVLVFSFSAFAAQYEVDTKTARTYWKGTKVTGFHEGTFALKSGTLDVEKKELKSGTVLVDMTSIKDTDLKDATDNAKLVGHLKSDDFFGAANFPVAELKITQVELLKDSKDGNTHELKGDLTIKGQTHPISFPAQLKWEGKNLTAKGTMTIDRTQYNVRYGSGKFFQNLGNKVIHDQFNVRVEFTAKPHGA
jgi:polyisoprenoid-binding protein YceI